MNHNSNRTRRRFIKTSVAASAALLAIQTGNGSHAHQPNLNGTNASPVAPSRLNMKGVPETLLNLRGLIKQPVIIKSIEVLRHKDDYFIRTISNDGAIGLAIINNREYLLPLMKELVVPFFIGKDARDLETLVDDVYPYKSNYKMAGIALWNAVGWVEVSLMDMLGRIADKSIAEMLPGGRRRDSVPVYMSSLRRDTTPQQEVAWLGKRLSETSTRAIKIKVGGRMSASRDALPGRTAQLVPLARKTFGDNVTIYADANSSYDARTGIEVGRMLEANGVEIYEEPCPFEEYEATKQVTDALTKLKVAGGEQDTSAARWRWIIENRAVDIVQPDIFYNGGFIRTARVALAAQAQGLSIAPHNPRTGAREAHLLQFVAWAENLTGFQEYRADTKDTDKWYSPHIELKDGKLLTPKGAGLGITIDPDYLRKAEKV